jgi:hypothetical protein
MKVLLIIPPFTQFNSPYPSTAYLKSYLQQLGHETVQVDVSLELSLKIFTKKFLNLMKKELLKKKKLNEELKFFINNFNDYAKTIEPVIQFLQTGEKELIKKMNQAGYLPEGPRFLTLDQQQDLIPLEISKLSHLEMAKYRATLYLDDLADYIKMGIDQHFGFSRYGESIASSASSFDLLNQSIMKDQTLITKELEKITLQLLQIHQPDIVGFSVPFPGNLVGALKMAHTIKKKSSKIYTVMGGGYPNTELRSIENHQFFKFIDFLIFDDGEKPLEQLLNFLSGKIKKDNLIRTYYLDSKNQLVKDSITNTADVSFKNLATPDFHDLDFKKYISMMEMPNQVHRLWSDGKWNKMILAHGCYWKKCTFCDVSLDYIGRYEPDKAESIVDKMVEISQVTGSNGFHFVDEAAPPQLLFAISEIILKRKLKFRWWGNIRFDAFFTESVCLKMKAAGCIAVTGGIEVASPRVLKLINKGVSLKQLDSVTKNFSHAGIFVHAYLMYGFPSQTIQETVDSLEVVRQFFLRGQLQSAFWHRFALTVHSPIAKNPEKYGVKVLKMPKIKNGLFAINEIPFVDKVKTPHDQLGVGLRKAVYNYMLRIGLELEVQEWFEIKVPKATFKYESLL